jgi:hypothetical protein
MPKSSAVRQSKIIKSLMHYTTSLKYLNNSIILLCLTRPTKGVTQVTCHSFCSCFVAYFIVINVAVTFDP